MNIGNVIIKEPVALAPMAGITDKAYRILVKELGCGLLYSEMVSAKALTYKNQKTFELLDLTDEKGPISIQIFGSEPDIMAEGARIVKEYKADIIDINMGCPVPKITKNNEGSSLMLNPNLASQIVTSIKKAVDIPVTVKIRKGWDDNNINAVEFAKRMEEAGADAIAVHGRTKEQLYSGSADWDIIREVKKAVKVPVLGNGDVTSPLTAKEMMDETKCDMVMVGRAAFGSPWLLGNIIKYLKDGTLIPEPSIEERVKFALRHTELIVKYKGEKIGIKEMRKHLGWYFKGLPGATNIRRQMNSITTKVDLDNLLYEYMNYKG